MKLINTKKSSENFRIKAINLKDKSISITNFNNTEQEKDLTEPANCNGFGRIRHFKLRADPNWPINPLPILPAAKALGKRPEEEIRTQIFQNSVCNWRCWYCFVDFSLLSGDPNKSSFLTCDEMLELYQNEKNPPLVLDLSGGQPDLTPEWIPWMMESLIERGLSEKIFLWSDDNLSNDYFWRFLSNDQINMVSSYKMYSRVCCFKGIDETSFSLNTKADPMCYAKQFSNFEKLFKLGIDLYGYVTLTALRNTNFDKVIPEFLDRLQIIHELLPLRIVPLQIYEFTPLVSRLNDEFKDMLLGQYEAIKFWNNEMQKRFTNEIRNVSIADIKLN